MASDVPARVLALVGSARRDGYTMACLQEVLAGAAQVVGVEVQTIHLLDHAFGPCTSCYACIRSSDHRCVLDDDLGRRGDTDLWRAVDGANAMLWATPVHGWSVDALLHLFIERLYPFTWSGELQGMPIAGLSVASNQGFGHLANEMLCQWSFTKGARWIGGLSVHMVYWEDVRPEARALGRRLAEAALVDAQGREPLDEESHWLAYENTPWPAYPRYLENLTRDSGDPRQSILRRALDAEAMSRPEAVEALRRADALFQRAAADDRLGRREEAIRGLVRASAHWTQATWKEYLEEKLIKAPQPAAYRPLSDPDIEGER